MSSCSSAFFHRDMIRLQRGSAGAHPLPVPTGLLTKHQEDTESGKQQANRDQNDDQRAQVEP
jgi:hypothetical protein